MSPYMKERYTEEQKKPTGETVVQVMSNKTRDNIT